jgi:hypothetical protein
MEISLKQSWEPIFVGSSPSTKIIATDVHLVQSWIATAHSNGDVIIWDYKLNRIAYEFNVGLFDEDKKDTNTTPSVPPTPIPPTSSTSSSI